MSNVHRLREKRAAAIAEARAICTQAEKAGRDLTTEERGRYDAKFSEAEALKAQIAREEQLEAEERDLATRASDPIRPDPGGGDPDAQRRARREAPIFRTDDGREIRGLLPSERIADLPETRAARLPDGIKPEELSLGRLVRALARGDWRGAEAEKRSMQVGDQTLGGVLVPMPMSARVVDLARNKARVFQAGAITLPMESTSLKIATLEGDVTASWRGERQPIPVSDATFAGRELIAHVIGGLTPISQELLEDAPNIGQMVEQSVSESLGLGLDSACLNGDGVGKPLGIRGWTSLGNDWGAQLVDMGTDGDKLLGYDTFADAYTKLLQVNAGPDGFAALMSGREMGELEKMKGGDGHYLAPPPFWSRVRAFATNQIPVSMTKGASTDASFAVLGDFSQVIVGMRTQLTVEVFRDSYNAETGLGMSTLTVFVRAYLRADMVLGRSPHLCVIDGIRPLGS